MLKKMRGMAQNGKGQTLIELLVVLLIIGILFAIALPAFLNQREKSQDGEAKDHARVAQTAMETWYTDHQTYKGAHITAPADGSFHEATLTDLEPSLEEANIKFEGDLTDANYAILVVSEGANGHEFRLTNKGGIVTRRCTPAGKGGCPESGEW